MRVAIADESIIEDGVFFELEEVWWCWTHRSATIYGHSAERDGRGVLYCHLWQGTPSETCDIALRYMAPRSVTEEG